MASSGASTPTIFPDPEDAYIQQEKLDRGLGIRPAEGHGAAPMAPMKFRHSFWDPEVAHLRKIYFKIMAPAVALMIFMMWISLPVFWGSLGETQQHVPKLKGWLVNRDGDGALGQAMVHAFEENTRGVGVPEYQHLTWTVMDPTSLPTDGDVMHGVVDEQVWAAVVVETDATISLTDARATGNTTYDPHSAVSFYFNQGRNEVAANSFINPYTTALIQTTLTKFNAEFTAQWLSTASPADIANAAQAPQTVSGPFSVTTHNLRPFTKTVSTAPLLIGMIYMTIVQFVMAAANDVARGVVAPFLKFGSYAKLRIAVPLLVYIPLSFSYAMISLPFKVTFGERFSYAGGFFLFWIFIYLTMASLGLAIEAMITFLTPRFTPNFLLLLIIFNVSVVNVPIALQPGFYRYGYAFPFFNLSQAIRSIIFNTKSHLGVNAGVFLAWIALSCCTITLFTWFVRRRAIVASKSADSEKGRK